MKPINFKDKQIERIGQEFGDAYIMSTKSYILCADALKDIIDNIKDPYVRNRVLKLTTDLENVQLMYAPEEGTNV